MNAVAPSTRPTATIRRHAEDPWRADWTAVEAVVMALRNGRRCRGFAGERALEDLHASHFFRTRTPDLPRFRGKPLKNRLGGRSAPRPLVGEYSLFTPRFSGSGAGEPASRPRRPPGPREVRSHGLGVLAPLGEDGLAVAAPFGVHEVLVEGSEEVPA